MPPSSVKIAPTPIAKYLFLFISHLSVAVSFRRAAIIRDGRPRREGTSPDSLTVIFFVGESFKLAARERMKRMRDPKSLGLRLTNACSPTPVPTTCGTPVLSHSER